MATNDDWRKRLEEDLAGLSGDSLADDAVVPDSFMTAIRPQPGSETVAEDAVTMGPDGTPRYQMHPKANPDAEPQREGESHADYMDRRWGAGNWAYSTAPVPENPMAPPPPPPPPPAPPPSTAPNPMLGTGMPGTPSPSTVPDDGGLSADLEAYARSFMSEPNRFLSDLVTQTREAGDLRRAESRERAGANIDELISSRGLVGSSIEADIRSDLERRLAADVSAEERELLNMLASYEAQDRLAGGEFGLDVAEFGRNTSIAQRELDLRAQELMQEAELEGRSLDLQEARDLANQELSQQQIDLRAQELMQTAELEGRALDIEEARNIAEQDIAREQMEHEFRLQTNELSQRESEFARTHGLDEREFLAEQDRFAQQFGEQVATRLQQDEHFRATLAAEDARFAVDSGLRERALDLQAQGMTMDDAFRRAALEQERDLTLSAQDLTRLGIDRDDAYRYAALEQDAGFRQRAQDLQEQGMQLDEAYRRAELEFRERDAERRDQSTRLAILVQTLNALGGLNGLGMDAEDIVRAITSGDFGNLPSGNNGDRDTNGTGEGVPDDGRWDPDDDRSEATWGPDNDMTYEEYLDWLATQDNVE